jgi:hypothetical protein
LSRVPFDGDIEQTTACEEPVVPVQDGHHVIGIFVPAKHSAVVL